MLALQRNATAQLDSAAPAALADLRFYLPGFGPTKLQGESAIPAAITDDTSVSIHCLQCHPTRVPEPKHVQKSNHNKNI